MKQIKYSLQDKEIKKNSGKNTENQGRVETDLKSNKPSTADARGSHALHTANK